MWARDDQLPPPTSTCIGENDWTTWLVLGGRGAGKTRAGAEWMRAQARRPIRIALIGETLADVRDVMVEGPSGLIAVAPPADRPKWIASKRRVEWPSGAQALAFSSVTPNAVYAQADQIADFGSVPAALTIDVFQISASFGRGTPRRITLYV